MSYEDDSIPLVLAPITVLLIVIAVVFVLTGGL